MSLSIVKRSVLSVILLAAGFSAASIAWSVRTKPCRDFEERVRSTASSLSKGGARSESERNEIVELLAQACLSELSRCNFRVCSERSTLTLLSSTSRLRSDSAPPTTTRSTEAPPSTERDRAGLSTPQGLSWLESDLSCDGFLREIQLRYPSLGRFSELAPETQSELKTILRVACSPRFQKCRFAACQPTSESKP